MCDTRERIEMVFKIGNAGGRGAALGVHELAEATGPECALTTVDVIVFVECVIGLSAPREALSKCRCIMVQTENFVGERLGVGEV